MFLATDPSDIRKYYAKSMDTYAGFMMQAKFKTKEHHKSQAKATNLKHNKVSPFYCQKTYYSEEDEHVSIKEKIKIWTIKRLLMGSNMCVYNIKCR